MPKLHRDGETEQVKEFLRYGHPRLAFAIVLIRRMAMAGTAICVAFAIGQSGLLPV